MVKKNQQTPRGSALKRSHPGARGTTSVGASGNESTSSNINTLQYGEDNLEAPNAIINSESQARKFYQDLLIDHSTRVGEYAKIQKQFDSKRPHDPKKLAEKGLAYLSNVNNGHARIHVNRYLSSEYNLIHAVQSPVTFKVRLLDKRTNHLIAKAMARAWKDVYPDWDEYFNQLDAMRLDKALYGIGVTLREFDTKTAKSSWKFKAISPDQFLCPLDTEIGRGALSKFCITYTRTVLELWDIYNTITDSDTYNGPWDKDALAWVLYRASQKASNKQSGQEDTAWKNAVLDMQRRLKNYDTTVLSSYSDDVPLVSVYTKEYGGGWSHTIIHESYHTNAPLFFKERQYDDIRDFLQIWFFEPNQKTVHSVRGLGYRIFQPVEVQNRLDNTLIDQAHLGSTVFVRTRQGRGRDAKSVKINLGAINDIGEAEFVQQLNASNIQHSLQVNQYQSQILERNVQFEKLDLDNPEDNKYRTLGEVGIQATKDAVLTKPQVSFFYRQYTMFLRDTVRLMYSRKADEYFKDWQERVAVDLAELQLPPEILQLLFTYPKDEKQLNLHGLPKWLDVEATRSTSSGSQVADILATNRMFQLAQFMGTDERYTFMQMATAAYSDHDHVDLFFPDKNRPMVFTDHQQKAIIENAILKFGTEIPVSPNDDHREEAPVHIQACQELVQQWAQGGDVIAIDDQMRMLYPHFLAHYTLLSQDPLSKAIFEGLAPVRGEIENQYRQIQANAANARLAQQRREEKERLERVQQQLRIDPNSPDNLKILVDHELKLRDQNLREARNLRAENLNAIKQRVKSNLETALTIQKFENSERRENIKLVSDLNKEGAKTNDTKDK